MHGCGLRIGEALAVSLGCRINRGKTLRVKEQVNPAAQLKPLKFRREGEFRDIPLPRYVSEAIDKHVAEHGTTSDGYLFQGRKYKLVVRRSYQEDFQRATAKAGLPPEFIPHSLRHLYASTAQRRGVASDATFRRRCEAGGAGVPALPGFRFRGGLVTGHAGISGVPVPWLHWMTGCGIRISCIQ
jgi:integrase